MPDDPSDHPNEQRLDDDPVGQPTFTGMSPPESIPPMSPPPEFASNYPRQTLTKFGSIRPPGVYWDSIGIAYSMVTANAGAYMVCSLILFGTLMAIYGVSMPFLFAGIFAGGLSKSPTVALGSFSGLQLIITTIVGLVLNLGYLCMASVGVQHAKQNVVVIGDFFIPFRTFGRTAVSVVIITVPLVIGQVLSLGIFALGATQSPSGIGLNMVAAIYYLGFYFWLLPVLVLSGVASVFNSKSLFQNAQHIVATLKWKTLLFGLLYVVGSIIAGLGAFLCCIGLLFTYPILSNVVALHYVYNFPDDLASPAVQPI